MSEEYDLFSFSFEDTFSEEKIQVALQEVIASAKSAGNHHSFHIKDYLTMTTRNILPELEKRGYLEVWGNGRMCQLYTPYKDWHDPEEIAAEYRKLCLQAIENGKNAYDLLSIHLWVEGPGIDEAFQKTRMEIFEMLGIEHARKDIKALGHLMSKDRKKNKQMINDIFNATRSMKDWREVDEYFHSTLFEEVSYSGTHFAQLIPSQYEKVCVAQSETIEDIKMLVSYFGSCWSRDVSADKRVIYLNKHDKQETIKQLKIEAEGDYECGEDEEDEYEDEEVDVA